MNTQNLHHLEDSRKENEQRALDRQMAFAALVRDSDRPIENLVTVFACNNPAFIHAVSMRDMLAVILAGEIMVSKLEIANLIDAATLTYPEALV